MPKKLLILCVLFFSVANVHAVTFDAAKTAILVDDTNANDPLKFKQAFAQIIANNTGENITSILRNSVFATANIKSGVKRSYFEKIDYRYLSEKSNYHYWFYVVMRKDFIDKIIRQSGFSVLPSKREKIMLWEVVNDAENDDLKYAYDDDKINYWLNHWAIALGVNLVNPNMDEQDVSAVSPASIKSLSFQAGKHSDNRYGINQSLLLYISETNDVIKIRSGYKISGRDIAIKHAQTNAAELGESLYAIVENVAHIYANTYRIDANNLQQHTVQIVVNALYSYDDANKVTSYFDDLSVIKSFTMVSAKVGQMVLTTELSVSNEAFFDILSRDGILSPAANASVNQLVLDYMGN